MKYPHKIKVEEIPVPPNVIRVVISTDYETHTTNHEFYAEPEQFLKFWEPLINYYEGVKREQNAN